MFVVHCLPLSTVQKRFMVLFMFFDWRGGGGNLFKNFPFFPPLVYPPTLLISDVLSFSLFYGVIKEREINHTFYIFLNKPVCVLLLSIINCYSL